MLLEVFEDARETSFGARVIIHVVRLHKVVRLLLNRVVGQVHKQVVEVVLLRAYVFLSREPRDAFLENEQPQRLDPVNKGVHAKVELQVIY